MVSASRVAEPGLSATSTWLTPSILLSALHATGAAAPGHAVDIEFEGLHGEFSLGG